MLMSFIYSIACPWINGDVCDYVNSKVGAESSVSNN